MRRRAGGGRREDSVAVIGGGPAGASAALELARRGLDAIVLERSEGTGNPIGECLAPTINALMQRLGLEDLLLASEALPSYGNRSSWGGDCALAERDFLREPFGHGWHLDRSAFNAALLERVEAAGIPVWRQARVVTLERGAGGWAIGVDLPEGTRTLAAAGVIDASGRAAVAARRLGVRRRRFDAQVAAVGLLEPAGGAPPLRDGTTVVAAAEAGWWYAALLPDGRLVATFFTDPDLLAATGVRRPEEWRRQLRACAPIWDIVSGSGYGMPERIQTVGAGSSLLTELAGDGWAAAGDAAAAYDPLSSHGIGSALAGGRHAAAALASALQGDGAALPAYSERIRAGYARYLWLRHAYYADERRWPDAPFWKRRHADALDRAAGVAAPRSSAREP